MSLLKMISAEDVSRTRHEPVDAATLAAVAPIVEDVRREGLAALRRHAERFGELKGDESIVIGPGALAESAKSVDALDLELLERAAGRIRAFAGAQLSALRAQIEVPVPGGRAGHAVRAADSAGCYAPGGRYPLPSSVLMTACVARAAGVGRVIVASPRPTPITLAAAHVAGADAVLTAGGAQAIAALAYGVEGLPPVDLIAGPGNKYVTAAKKLVHGAVGIDMLAGPSELVVLADGDADPGLIAADLLAQAEHDEDARPILVTTSKQLVDAVNGELDRQLTTLPTAATARAALGRGFAVVVPTVEAAAEVSNALAPEHLEILTADLDGVVKRCRNYGAVFLGPGSAEVFGDYGVGPNHTLPTGGSARFSAGLSIFTFLRAQTWLRMDSGGDQAAIVADTARFARLEGLEGHARAAERRHKR